MQHLNDAQELNDRLRHITAKTSTVGEENLFNSHSEMEKARTCSKL